MENILRRITERGKVMAGGQWLAQIKYSQLKAWGNADEMYDPIREHNVMHKSQVQMTAPKTLLTSGGNWCSN